MYLLYLDESGSPNNMQESHFVLAGLSVFERQVHFLIKQLDELAAEIQPENPDAVEFHAAKAFSGNSTPWRGMSKLERRQITFRILDLIKASHESTSLFACAVHKESFPNEDPVLIAFEQLISRFDLQLKRMYHADDPQRGMIIFDKTSYESGLQRLTKEYRQLGTRWGMLKNLVDVPMFVDSKASRIVQLADHVAHAVFRRYESGDTLFLDRICSRFDSESGKLHGLVHWQHAWPDCMCPACLSRRHD